MANYTLAINWSLSDTDPSKVISGSDFNTEFTTAKTAINTKADLNGADSEAFSVTTEAASSNTTVAASTAYVTRALVGHDTKIDIMKAVYPLGSIFTTVSDSSALATTAAEVATLMGFGTWVTFGVGKVLVGIDTSGTPDEDFDTSEETGGRKDAVLPEHTHDTSFTMSYNYSSQGTNVEGAPGSQQGTKTYTSTTAGVELTGNENLQPYVVVYMWKRTA